MKSYLEKSAATNTHDFDVVRDRLSDENIDLLHVCLGLTTEVGEVVDQVKKHVFYGRGLDRVNLKEEVGDILWYLAVLLRRLDSSFEDAAELNLAKLAARYGGKFSERAANVRDIEKERKILEGGM